MQKSKLMVLEDCKEERDYYLRICFDYGYEQTIVNTWSKCKEIRKEILWKLESSNDRYHHIFSSGVDLLIDLNKLVLVNLTETDESY